jgi:uncharacterized protein YndB with AHSA1/START domain
MNLKEFVLNPNVLQIKRTIPAEIGSVFEAWSSAHAMSRWFVVDPAWTARAWNEFRVGGKFRVEMSHGDRIVGIAFGEFLAIEPPHKIVFTWTSEGGVGVQDTIVTIGLKQLATGTELTLTHNLDPHTKEGLAHARGWEGSLASLELFLTRQVGSV